MQTSIWLAEITAWTGSETIVLRFASDGYTSQGGDTPAHTYYDGVISDAGIFTQHLFGAGRTLGAFEMELGALGLSNADGALDYLLDYAFDGQSVTLKRLPAINAPLSSAETMYVAMVEGLDASSGSSQLYIRFYDQRRVVDKAIQSNTYGGTSIGAGLGVDGSADLAGQLKPLVFGRVFHVQPIIVNAFDLVLQVNDGAVSEITLYDGGVELLNDGDVASAEALVAASIVPGRYKTCLALGLMRPGGAFRGRPGFVWTADVVEGVNAADRTASAVALRILAKIGLNNPSDVDQASFDGLSGTAPQEVGIFINAETSALTAIRQVLDSVGAYIIPDQLGRFTVGQLNAPGVSVGDITPEMIELDEIGIQTNPDTEGNIPCSKFIYQFGRNNKVFGDTEIGSCVTQSDPARADGLRLEFREIVLEDAGVKTVHPLAPSLTITGLLTTKVDADAEASRQFELYKTDRYVVDIPLSVADATAFLLNTTCRLKVGRLGLQSGRDMVVIGRAHEFGNERVTLTLWG